MAKKEFNYMDLINVEDDIKNRQNIFNLSPEKLIENDNNNYELTDIEQLANSIEQLGLLQPLLVKKIENGKYEIVAGHRRFNAIKKLIKEERIDTNYEIQCKAIVDEENELITRLKLHETNLQTRSLLKMGEDEKLAVIEDYMDILNKAREQGLEINGKKIKGKTRDLVAERFNISDRTAQKLINDVKENDKGGKISPPKEKPSNIEKVEKTITKLSKELDKLSADELEEVLHSDTLSEEKNNIFLSLFQSKMKV